jgi:hypothetical protein
MATVTPYSLVYQYEMLVRFFETTRYHIREDTVMSTVSDLARLVTCAV